MLKVKIASPQEIVPIDRPRLKVVARVVLEGEGVADAAVSLAFVDNATIHRLNKQFLNHDEPTDVISFPLNGPGARTLEGEIVVGAEVARARAAELRHDEQQELALYVIHGLLHLCGYDDTTDTAVRRMRARERHFLKVLGLPDIAEAD
jgi:probable rRNA maturation factor